MYETYAPFGSMAKKCMGHVLMPTMWVRLLGCTQNSVGGVSCTIS
jgi:hypothetical protein